jgi:putative sterol carrier protein
MTGPAIDALVDRLQAPVLPPRLQAATLRYRFMLDRGETRDLLLERGRLRVAEPSDPPDCVLECTSEELHALLTGRHNLLTAVMRGDVRVRGTLPVAKTLYTYLRYAQLEEAKG